MTITVIFRTVPVVVTYTHSAEDLGGGWSASVEIESVHTAHGDDVTEWFADEWRDAIETAALEAHNQEYRATVAELAALERDDRRAG